MKVYTTIYKALPFFALCILTDLYAQIEQDNNAFEDSMFIVEIENKAGPAKVLHAEPLYIDLIRDLGARKGEKEWNVGLGLTDKNTFDEYTALVEYEWAPVNRLGFEVELPFSFYYPTREDAISPQSRLNSFKLATQYTFWVSDKWNTSAAIGYIHEFELTPFINYSSGYLFEGNLYNPFAVIAKRWGNNFHTLLYTGPQIASHFKDPSPSVQWQFNTNFHYMIPGTRNFIGVEFNPCVSSTDFDMTIRPQMRLLVTDQLMLGIVTGIPISRESERFSTFLRLIYEPHHK